MRGPATNVRRVSVRAAAQAGVTHLLRRFLRCPRGAGSQGMVLSSGWAGEKRFSTWFSGDQPVAQWQKAQARKQFEVFSKLYDDGKRHREHMYQRTQPVLPIWGRDDYERNVSLEQWNPWSPGKRACNRPGGTHAVSQALVSLGCTNVAAAAPPCPCPKSPPCSPFQTLNSRT
ncbi:MAG: hypothetical protein ACPIOQ_47930 [Promethearchaeia archaeon]